MSWKNRIFKKRKEKAASASSSSAETSAESSKAETDAAAAQADQQYQQQKWVQEQQAAEAMKAASPKIPDPKPSMPIPQGAGKLQSTISMQPAYKGAEPAPSNVNSAESELAAKGDANADNTDESYKTQQPVDVAPGTIETVEDQKEQELPKKEVPEAIIPKVEPQAPAAQTSGNGGAVTAAYPATNAEIDAAQKELDAANNEKLDSFRALLDRYKPESPEDAAKRERRERIMRNTIGLMNMGAAIGNLATAASSRDGRSAATPNLNEAANNAIDKQRALRKERDAKYDEANQKLHEAKLAMAQQKYAKAWDAYKQEQANQLAREKMAHDAKKHNDDMTYKFTKLKSDDDFRRWKQENEDAYKKEQLAFNNAKLDEDKRHNLESEKIARIRAAASKNGSKGSGSGSSSKAFSVSLNNGRQTLNMPGNIYSNKVLLQELETALPPEYNVTKKVKYYDSSGNEVSADDLAVTTSVNVYYDGYGKEIAEPTADQKRYAEYRIDEKGKEKSDYIYKLIADYVSRGHDENDPVWQSFKNVIIAAGCEIVDNEGHSKIPLKPVNSSEKELEDI